MTTTTNTTKPRNLVATYEHNGNCVTVRFTPISKTASATIDRGDGIYRKYILRGDTVIELCPKGHDPIAIYVTYGKMDVVQLNTPENPDTTAEVDFSTKKAIYNRVASLNVTPNHISSLGSYVSQSQQMAFDHLYIEIMEAITDGDSLAYRILLGHDSLKALSQKQVWVIVFELLKNDAYVSELKKERDMQVSIAQREEKRRNDKLKANKEASEGVLEPIRKLRKLSAFDLWLNSKSNPFRKQCFTKKYTTEAVNAYLATL